MIFVQALHNQECQYNNIMMKKVNDQFSLQAITKFLSKTFGQVDMTQQILSNLSRAESANDELINKMYISIVNIDDNIQRSMSLLHSFNDNLVLGWILDAYQGNASMSKKSLLQILELLYWGLEFSKNIINSYSDGMLQGNHDQLMQNLYRKKQPSQGILKALYTLVTKSEQPQTLGLYLSCINMIRQMSPEKINNLLYAQMISEFSGKDMEFYLYFKNKITDHQDKDIYRIRNYLLKGLLKRMKLVASKNYIQYEQKNYIYQAYQSLANLLNQKPQWCKVIIDSYGDLIVLLNGFLSNNLHTNIMARILNKMIQAFMKSKINNHKKYQIALNFYTEMLQRSPKIYPFITTELVTDEQEFLVWFKVTQLKAENSTKLSKMYMQNQQSIEFFLLLNIFVLNQSQTEQAKIQQIKLISRLINLLQQAKYYISKEDVQNCLRVLYKLFDEQDQLQEFMNSLEDQTLFRN